MTKLVSKINRRTSHTQFWIFVSSKYLESVIPTPPSDYFLYIVWPIYLIRCDACRSKKSFLDFLRNRRQLRNNAQKIIFDFLFAWLAAHQKIIRADMEDAGQFDQQVKRSNKSTPGNHRYLQTQEDLDSASLHGQVSGMVPGHCLGLYFYWKSFFHYSQTHNIKESWS